MHLEQLSDQSEAHTGEALLAFYIREWFRYTAAAKHIHNVFRVLHRHWLRREMYREDIYDVYTLHLVLWKSVLLDRVSLGVVDTVLNQIEKERNGETIEQHRIKQLADSFVALGLDKESAPKTTLDIYRNHFEQPFLKETKEFYQVESKQFVAENDVVEYMKKVEARLEEETERVRMYLHDTTTSPLQVTCCQALIADHSNILQSEFEILLSQGSEENLARMYYLLSRIPDGLGPILSKFKTHVRHLGSAAAAEAGTDQQKLKPKLLEIYTKYQALVKTAFKEDPKFMAILFAMKDNAAEEVPRIQPKSTYFGDPSTRLSLSGLKISDWKRHIEDTTEDLGWVLGAGGSNNGKKTRDGAARDVTAGIDFDSDVEEANTTVNITRTTTLSVRPGEIRIAPVEAEFGLPPLYRKSLASSSNSITFTLPRIGTICKNCSDLNLKAAFEREQLAEDGYVASKQRPWQRWFWIQSRFPCNFCQFWLRCKELQQENYSRLYETTRPDPRSDIRCIRDIRGTDYLHQYRDREPVFELVEYDDIQSYILRVRNILIGHSVINAEAVDQNSFRAISPKFQMFDVIKQKLEQCRGKHHNCRLSRQQNDVAPLLRIRVLDCKTQRIVSPAESYQYLALSYRWGSEQQTTTSKDGRLLRLPQTIKDAVTVTLLLGFQYLWIDRYCINQRSQQDMEIQLGQMDRIYQNAEITIIAAAGETADHGLAGISVKRKSSQASVTVDGVRVVSLIANPWEEVRNSTWYTRGWTYQEGLFSRRRLFLMPTQAIFDCFTEWNAESATMQPKLVEGKTDPHISQPIDFWDERAPPITVYMNIAEYTRRKLSFSSDIINAFSGTFRAFQRTKNAVYSHWGIPLLLEPYGRFNSFIFGLKWKFTYRGSDPDPAPDADLRRYKFPSWSWTGWENEVYYWMEWEDAAEYERKLSRIAPHPDTTVSIELNDGSVIPWKTFEENLHRRPESHYWASRFVWIQALSIPFNLLKNTEQPNHTWKSIQLEGTDGAVISKSICGFCQPGMCMGIVLERFTSERDDRGVIFLISEKEGYWERVTDQPIDIPPYEKVKLLTQGENFGVKLEKRLFRLG